MDRQCDNPFDEPDDCPLTDYVEVVAGERVGHPEAALAILFWLGPSGAIPTYTYELRPLRDAELDGTTYMIETMSSGREWFVLKDDEIVQYESVGYVAENPERTRQRAHLRLKRVERSLTMNKILSLQNQSDR